MVLTLQRLASRIPTPIYSLLGVIALVLAATAAAGASQIPTDLTSASAGPIGNTGAWASNAIVIPGTASLTGCAIGVAGVQHAVDAQKQNVIRYATGAAIGGTVGTVGAATVPGMMIGMVNKTQGALILHAHLVAHVIHHFVR